MGSPKGETETTLIVTPGTMPISIKRKDEFPIVTCLTTQLCPILIFDKFMFEQISAQK
jgi:hypothetical protein